MSWRAVVHCAIGTRHQRRQLPCQDYGDFRIAEAVMIGAVADGAGSARYAEVGAKLAVETALVTLAELARIWIESSSGLNKPPQVEGGGVDPGGETRQTALCFPDSAALTVMTETQAREMFVAMATEVVDALKMEAIATDCPLGDLACTLLCFIATPAWMAAMQIGDGFLVVGDADSTYELLFRPDKGEYINETCFLTSPRLLENMQVRVYPGQPQFICAATDGLEKVAIRLRDWLPFPPFFKPLTEWLRLEPETADTYLQAFLNSDRLNAHTDDDKTLLLGYFQGEEAG